MLSCLILHLFSSFLFFFTDANAEYNEIGGGADVERGDHPTEQQN